MRRTLLITGQVFLTFCFLPLAWGSEDQPFEQIAQRWAAIVSEQPDPTVPSSNATLSPLFQTAITSTFALAPVLSNRLRDLSPETDGPRTKGILAKTTWMKGTFVTETEIANSSGGAGWLQNTIPGDTRADSSARMIRLGFTGTKG